MSKQPNDSKKTFSKESLQMLFISTILAFVVGKFLDPVFRYLYSLLINTGGIIIQQLSNSTYKQISDGYSEQPSLFVFYILLLAASGLLANFFSFVKNTYIKEREKYNTYKKALDIITAPFDEDTYQVANASSEAAPTLQKDPYILEKEINLNFKNIKKQFIIMVVMMVLLYAYILFSYSRTLFVNNIITSITNNIEIVSPYISDIEYKQLKSKFHSMENSNDYDALISSLSDIAEKNSVKLKK